MIREAIKGLYRTVFARCKFERFNRFVFELSLNGLGILNWESTKLSGEDHFLRWFLKDKIAPVVVDVGANVGHYAIKVRELAPESRVFAIEAHPGAFNKLRENANRYGFQALNLACGNEEGKSTLFDYMDVGGSEHASMYRDVIEQIHHSKSQRIDVTTAKLDDLISQMNLSVVDLVKVDVEGAEYEVLLGLSKSLREKKVAAVQFEFNEMNVVSRKYFRDFVQLLDEYDLYRMLPRGLLPIQYSAVVCELFAYQNIVALRRDSEAQSGDKYAL